MPTHIENVAEFMRRAGQEIPRKPTTSTEEIRMLRAKLILEEALETIDAMGFDPHVRVGGANPEVVPIQIGDIEYVHCGPPLIDKIADGLADLSVVTIGAFIHLGIDPEPILKEVDRANLRKFEGDAHKRDDGKWIKPSDFKEPNIADNITAYRE